MKKRRRGRVRWGLFILLITAAALLTGYFVGKKKGSAESKIEALVTNITPGENRSVSEVAVKIPIDKEALFTENTEEIEERREDPEPPDKPNDCKEMENRIRDFSRYLDDKNYIKRLDPEMDTFDRFKRLSLKLSDHPPIPAGEILDSEILINNIFFFFRILGSGDLRLVRKIVINEADTLEIHLDLLYKWLVHEDRCPDLMELRPSPDTPYLYAGFLINTIGGRAYLFRRTTGMRLLISYYCLLIIHEADKIGKNTYGIDILPEITPLAKEISRYPDFQFQRYYLTRLYGVRDYYISKRRGNLQD